MSFTGKVLADSSGSQDLQAENLACSNAAKDNKTPESVVNNKSNASCENCDANSQECDAMFQNWMLSNIQLFNGSVELMKTQMMLFQEIIKMKERESAPTTAHVPMRNIPGGLEANQQLLTSSESQAAKRPRIEQVKRPRPRLLENLDYKRVFSQYLHVGTIRKVKVDPGKLERVFRATYQSMKTALGSVMSPPITETVFVKVCKVLLYCRLQFIEESMSGVSSRNRALFARGMLVPQPLGELLYAIGKFESTRPYVKFQPVCVPISTKNPPDWNMITASERASFIQFTSLTHGRYKHVTFPPIDEYNGSAIFFCTKKIVSPGTEQIFIYNSEPTPSDIFLRLVHEEFFVEPPYAVGDCGGVGSVTVWCEKLISAYTGSYVIKNF
ncbi:hypothetical protein DMENIID0001_014240 [Sergentomyia squamirostris]